jgi:hypothetical protein
VREGGASRNNPHTSGTFRRAGNSPQALQWLITPECFSETESLHDVPKPAFIGGLWFFSTRLFEDSECHFSRAALWV